MCACGPDPCVTLTETPGISGTPVSYGHIFLVEKCVNYDNLHDLYIILRLCLGPFANVEA